MPLPPLLTPTYNIRVDNQQPPTDLLVCISKITVEIDRNLPGLFQIEFFNVDLEMALKQFSLGTEVEIQFSVKDPLTETPSTVSLITGEVLGLEPQFTSDRAFRLVIWGCDSLHKLQRGSKTKTFLNLTDSQIAMAIGSGAGLTVNVVDSKIIHEFVMQTNQTDLQFLRQRAQQIGYEIFVEGRTLFFQPILHRSPSQSLTLGEDLLEFYPRLSLASQPTAVTVKGWDVLAKRAIVETSSEAKIFVLDTVTNGDSVRLAKKLGTAETVICDRPVSIDTAKQMAQAYLDQMGLELITGEGTCLGNPNLKPGTSLIIGNLPRTAEANQAFHGKYYVTGVTHRLMSDEGFFTDFRVKRDAL